MTALTPGFPAVLRRPETLGLFAGGAHPGAPWWPAPPGGGESADQPATFSKDASSGNPFPKQLASPGPRACQGGRGVPELAPLPAPPPRPGLTDNFLNSN